MAKIVIECGHGGKDTGSIGNGKREVDLNLIITNKLLNILGKTHTVLGIGNDNSQPQERGKKAAQWGCDLHLSIHHNVGGGTGVEVWKSVFANSKIGKVATDIASTISKDLGYRNRGVKTRWNSKNNADYYGVIRGNSLHNTLIVECCFIDNKADMDKWNADKIANAIANAVYENFGGKLVAQPKKTNEEIAKEVITGKWGNNPKRKEDLIKAGYDYTAIQKIVNELLKPTPKTPEPVKPAPPKPEPKPEPVKPEPIMPEILVGDIDGDGKVTIKDALLALRHVAGITTLTAEQIARGDLDKDGKITIQDAVRILKLAAK